MTKPPKILDKVADLVLSYRPSERQKPPKKRKPNAKWQKAESKDKRD